MAKVPPKTIGKSQPKRVYSGILPAFFDKITMGHPDDVTEVYTYQYQKASDGTYVVSAIIEVVYMDSTKECISSVTKTYQNPYEEGVT